jgi:iron(II)-dependent oxidoreductase
MSGNAWEWTTSLWGRDYQKSIYNYPYRAADGRENLDAPPHMAHVLRGGAYYNHARDMRCAVQYWNGSFYRVDDLGFRVVASPVS